MSAVYITDSQLSDEELSSLSNSGSRNAEEELVLRYMRLVRACSRPYFLAGADSEDLIQEGMLGLIAAIREYNPERKASFRTYAELCIKRRLYSAIRAAARDKHSPLNNYISFEAPLFDGNSDHAAYIAPLQDQRDPEELIIGREEFKELSDALNGQLSKFEAEILGLYLKGLSYQEIAVEVNKTPKSVDNAVQRIKRKLARQD